VDLVAVKGKTEPTKVGDDYGKTRDRVWVCDKHGCGYRIGFGVVPPKKDSKTQRNGKDPLFQLEISFCELLKDQPSLEKSTRFSEASYVKETSKNI